MNDLKQGVGRGNKQRSIEGDEMSWRMQNIMNSPEVRKQFRNELFRRLLILAAALLPCAATCLAQPSPTHRTTQATAQTPSAVITAAENSSDNSTDPQQELAGFRVILLPLGSWSGIYPLEKSPYKANTILLPLRTAGRLNDRGPEFTDLNLHLAALDQWMNQNIPESFTGIIILDLSGFPISLKSKSAGNFLPPRLQEIRRLNPQDNDNEVLTKANHRWQTALSRVYIASIDRLRSLQPGARIALLHAVDSADDQLLRHDAYTEPDQDTLWLWKKIDIITPRITFTARDDEAEQYHNSLRAINDSLRRAQRIADLVEKKQTKRPGIIPMLNSTITRNPDQTQKPSPYLGHWLTQPQMKTAFENALQNKATGIIITQMLGDRNPKLPNEQAFISNILQDRLHKTMIDLALGPFANLTPETQTPMPITTPNPGQSIWNKFSANRIINPDAPYLSPDLLRMVRVIRHDQSADSTVENDNWLDDPRTIILQPDSKNNRNIRNTRNTRRPNSRSRTTNRKSSTRTVIVKRVDKNDPATEGVKVTKKSTNDKN